MPDREIELLIRSLGINGTYRGYRYLCYGIKLCLEDEDYLLCISKLLYPEIARSSTPRAAAWNGISAR